MSKKHNDPRVVNVDVSLDGRPLGTLYVPVPEGMPTRLSKLVGEPMWKWYKEAIERTFILCDCNLTKAAQVLEISERTMFRKIKELEIDTKTLHKQYRMNKNINRQLLRNTKNSGA